MNQKQLKKILSSINNKINNKINEVKSSISEVSLTDEDFMATLDENDYLIPINIKINGWGGTRFYYIKITNNHGDIILEQEFDGALFNSNIYVTRDKMYGGLQIHAVHDYYGHLDEVLMNGSIVSEGIDYEYTRTEDNNKAIIDIILNQITGDILIEISCPPPS